MGNCLNVGGLSSHTESTTADLDHFFSKELEDLRGDSDAIPLIAFTYKELKAMTENFKQDYLLGRGGFGSVYKGFIKANLRKGLQPLQIAVKVRSTDNVESRRCCLAELRSLAQLSHPNLIKLIGYCLKEAEIYIIYEFMPRGHASENLFSREMPALSWAIRMKIAVGAARGLAFLHEAKSPIIYRDCKLSSILLNSEYNAKLSNFELAREGPVGDKTHVTTRIIGTMGYIAPEYIMTGNLTAMSDVYCFGVVLLELLTGRRALASSPSEDKVFIVDWALPLITKKRKILDIVDQRLDGDYPVKAALKTAMLAFHCLNLNPKARPLMRDIVEVLETLQMPLEIPNCGTM